jgi:putative PIN family toxin of toxin-antitoxin system
VKAIVDTNVVLSGFFFGGLPGRVLEAWRDDRFTFVLSAPILAEYREAGAEFEAKYGGSDFEAFAALLLVTSEVVEAPEHLPQPVCADPDDDKFLACAGRRSSHRLRRSRSPSRTRLGWYRRPLAA